MFDLFSNFKWVNSQGFLWSTSEARDNPYGPFMVSRKLSIRDEPNIRLRCSRNAKNTCFTDEKRHRVYVQSVFVSSGTTRTHVETCARGAGTHGDVLNLRTEGFACQAAPHTTPHKTHTHTTQTMHTNTPQHTETERQRERERDRDRDRQRQRQREKRRRKRRDKTREEKTKEDKTRSEKREDIFSVVVHGRFLLVL